MEASSAANETNVRFRNMLLFSYGDLMSSCFNMFYVPSPSADDTEMILFFLQLSGC